nr:MauE/DoxX family redox-associated membrane protein [Streptomyces spinoverrucosus]
MAIGVVTTEAVIVVALAVPATVAVGFGIAVLLLSAFTAGLVGVLRRGTRESCHCFGGGSSPVTPRHVVRNAILIAAALVGLLAPDGGDSAPAGLLLAAGVAVILAAVTVALDDLAELFATADARVPR